MLAPSSHVCVDTVSKRKHIEMCDVEHVPLNTVKVKDYTQIGQFLAYMQFSGK